MPDAERVVLKNFNFCGTGIHATYQGSASLAAIRKFKNTMILSGLGAKSSKDEGTGEYYPTPGTFESYYQNDGDRLVKKQRETRLGERFYTGLGVPGLGFLRGTGEEDNIQAALKVIEHEYKKHIDKKDQDIPVINIAGYSRGGASGIRLANEIYKRYGARIEVNLFLMDPNAGFGRHDSRRKINIPPCVKNVYFTFSEDEKNFKDRFIYKSKGLGPYQIVDSSTTVTATVLPGTHEEQDKIPKQEQDGIPKKERPVASEVNQYLMEQFFNKHAPSDLQDGLMPQPEAALTQVKKRKAITDKRRLHYANHGEEKDGLHPIMRGLIPSKKTQIYKKDFSGWKTLTVVSPELKKLNEALTDLSSELKILDKDKEEKLYKALLDVNYKGYMLLNKLIREGKELLSNQDNLKALANATTELIEALKPSGDLEEIEAKHNKFKNRAHVQGFSSGLRVAAGKFSGAVTGFLGGLTLGLGGFLGGLVSPKNAIIGAVPTAFITGARGAKLGYRMANRTVSGHKEERDLAESAKKAIKIKRGKL